MESVKGAFTVRFLRIGDDVYIVREIYRIDNGIKKGAALFQAVDTTSGALSVDWTDPNQQPICEFRAVSAVGYPVSITESSWVYDGEQLVFSTADPDGWRTSTNGKFQIKHEEGKVFFKIIDNIASPANVANRMVSYNLSYISNGVINSYVGSMDIVIQQAGSDSHHAIITTPRIILDEANPSTTLTLQATYGVKAITIGQDGYTVEWYQDNVKMAHTDAALTVHRDDIHGASMFMARLLHNGVPVAQDGQHINDVADEFQVRVHKFNDFVTEKVNAQYEFYLLRNGNTIPTENELWSWQVYNAMGDLTKSGVGKDLVITKDECLNIPLAGGAQYYSDANYVGEVNVTLI
ncbi:MAG: hypothetical protein WC914_00010 [Proteiniphilum sp.]